MSIRYRTGELVREGDRIRYYSGGHWLDGSVKTLVSAGSQVSDTDTCEHDGAFFEVYWESAPGLILDTPETGILDEDYELVARCETLGH